MITMVTTAAGFHITRSTPFRPCGDSAADLPLPRSLLEGQYLGETAEPFAGRDHRWHHWRRRAAGGPAGGFARGPAARRYRPRPSFHKGLPRVLSLPFDRSARRDFVPLVGCGFAPHMTCRGDPSGEGARRIVGVSDGRTCDRSPQAAGCKARPGTAADSFHSPPPEKGRGPARAVPGLGTLIRGGLAGARVRACPPPGWTGP